MGKEISLPPSENEYESLKSEERELVNLACQKQRMNYIFFIVGIVGLVNQAFFALESSCKIIGSLGCIHFSIRFASNLIIQHSDVWQVLKRLGKLSEEGINCKICRVNNSCKFSVNFEALANVYCYAIKIRMLSDYDDLFYSHQESWEKVELYFDKIEKIINENMMIKNKCFEVV